MKKNKKLFSQVENLIPNQSVKKTYNMKRKVCIHRTFFLLKCDIFRIPLLVLQALSDLVSWDLIDSQGGGGEGWVIQNTYWKNERLPRQWSANPKGSCLCPSCFGLEISEDVEHILLHCPSLSTTRASLAKFTLDYAKDNPDIQSVLLEYTKPTNPLFVQFLLDCSVIPRVISLTQLYGTNTLFKLFKVTRAWCYSLHRNRLKLLGRWSLS